MQTMVRLLLGEQSDQGLHCLPFHMLLLYAYCIANPSCPFFRIMVVILDIPIFSSLVRMYSKSYCTILGVGVGVGGGGMDKMLKFYVKVFM